MSGYIMNSNIYVGSTLTKVQMVAAQNCFGFANFSYGGMLGLGQNTNFDPKNLIIEQLNNSKLISNMTFGVQFNLNPQPSFLTIGIINATAVTDLYWNSVYDDQSEFWSLTIDQAAINGTYDVPLNATYASLDS